jgi:putative transposase
MYHVRRVNIGKTAQLDELAHACGELYSKTLVFFWRPVRHKRKRYFRIEYKRSAMSLHDGLLRLSNGKGNEPLLLDWPWDLPQTAVIHWKGTQYEAIATYPQEKPQASPQGEQVAGVDLGEIHLAVSHDRELESELSTSGASIWTWVQWSGT